MIAPRPSGAFKGIIGTSPPAEQPALIAAATHRETADAAARRKDAVRRGRPRPASPEEYRLKAD